MKIPTKTLLVPMILLFLPMLAFANPSNEGFHGDITIDALSQRHHFAEAIKIRQLSPNISALKNGKYVFVVYRSKESLRPCIQSRHIRFKMRQYLLDALYMAYMHHYKLPVDARALNAFKAYAQKDVDLLKGAEFWTNLSNGTSIVYALDWRSRQDKIKEFYRIYSSSAKHREKIRKVQNTKRSSRIQR